MPTMGLCGCVWGVLPQVTADWAPRPVPSEAEAAADSSGDTKKRRAFYLHQDWATLQQLFVDAVRGACFRSLSKPVRPSSPVPLLTSRCAIILW